MFPNLDAFTTHLNMKCPHFCSRSSHHPASLGTVSCTTGGLTLRMPFAPSSDTAGNMETLLSTCPDLTFDSVVAQAGVVPFSPTTLRTHVPQLSTSSGPPAPHDNERSATPPPRCSLSHTYSLEHCTLTFFDHVHESILNSHKPSTKKSYHFKRLQFLRWLSPSYQLPEEVDLPVVFEFLMHLVDCGLSYSPIKVYLLVLSAYHR